MVGHYGSRGPGSIITAIFLCIQSPRTIVMQLPSVSAAEVSAELCQISCASFRGATENAGLENAGPENAGQNMFDF